MKPALRTVPALAWAGLIFWLSSQPRLPAPPFAFPGADKLAHAAAFGLLALLVLFALPVRSLRAALAAVVLATAYGLADEVHQAFVAGRSSDALDLLADAAGAGLFAFSYEALRDRRRRAARRPGDRS